MANRHLSRSIVLQALFERDFCGLSRDDTREALKWIANDTSSTGGDIVFMEELLLGIVDHISDIDLVIEKAAPEWPLDRISFVDRNILRIGLFELLFSDRSKVPAKVAINEAIELGKTFGGDNSGRFVNGVLGAVYKELGEPGKEDSMRKKTVPFDNMPIERLVGAVVFARHESEIYLALVHDIFGHWTLSKGRIDPEEDLEAGVIRKILEEINLHIKPIEKIGENEYVASDPNTGKKRKQVTYFLAESPFSEIKLEEGKGGLDDARWFKLKEALELNFYEDITPFITKAVQKLTTTG